MTKNVEYNPAFKQFHTAEDKRMTYDYYDADGNLIVQLIAGENGVTSLDIKRLHEADDYEVSHLYATDKRYFPRHIRHIATRLSHHATA